MHLGPALYLNSLSFVTPPMGSLYKSSPFSRNTQQESSMSLSKSRNEQH